MTIKIYNKAFSALTTLLQSGTTNSDFNTLTYTDTLMETGTARFTMRLDNTKATEANLRHFNKVEICDDDGTVRWVGVIVGRDIKLNTVEVTCSSLIYMLEKRLTGADQAVSGQAGTEALDLLADTNAVEATGITAGSQNVTTTVNLTFNRTPILQAIRSLAEATGAQFEVTHARALNFKTAIGQDLSATVTFKYDITLIAEANIIQFDVVDLGAKIATRSHGESDALTSTQNDSGLQTTYGILETYRNFREAGNQGTLDSLTGAENKDAEYSPSITLIPTVADNFEVGDTIRLVLKNRIINIDADHQITEKTVELVGRQKRISVRVMSNVSDFFQQLKNLRRDIGLLERNV